MEDMVKAGVIDPAKVVRTALENAASVNGYTTPYVRGDTDDVGNIAPLPRDVDITDFNNLDRSTAVQLSQARELPAQLREELLQSADERSS